MDVDALLPHVNKIATQAGKAILEIYNEASVEIVYKNDHSPLTEADTRSHREIVQGLAALTPSLPLISEEGETVPYSIRKHWETYWLIDPLDGTKEFIKRNGQFTVNIALIKDGIPVLGCIFVPVSNELYFATKLGGAFKKLPDEMAVPIFVNHGKTTDWVSVGSSSHANAEDNALLEQFPVKHQLTAGSSLKFCYVAEGKADVYVRTGPTMEWDTAAGQCIAECAGAVMTQNNGSPFVYNKENMLNPGFVCKIR